MGPCCSWEGSEATFSKHTGCNAWRGHSPDNFCFLRGMYLYWKGDAAISLSLSKYAWGGDEWEGAPPQFLNLLS